MVWIEQIANTQYWSQLFDGLCRYAFIMAFTDMVIRKQNWKLFWANQEYEKKLTKCRPNNKKKKKVEKRYKNVSARLEYGIRFFGASCWHFFLSFLFFSQILLLSAIITRFFPFNVFNKRWGKKAEISLFSCAFFMPDVVGSFFSLSLSPCVWLFFFCFFVRFCLNIKTCVFVYLLVVRRKCFAWELSSISCVCFFFFSSLFHYYYSRLL